ncbi:MAG: hypothetical protein AAFR17_05690 [Pseudomonadota bacterium]
MAVSAPPRLLIPRWAVVILALALAPLVWWYWPVAALPARFAESACHHLPLRDAETGAEITGIEDIARLPDGRLVLSAYDRLDPAQPNGGLYLFTLDEALANPPFLPRLRPALPAKGLSGGLRPHGIAAHPELPLVAVINRGRDGGVRLLLTTYEAREQRLRLSDEGAADSTLCAANDLAFQDLTLWITLDRGICGAETLSTLLGLEYTGLLLTMPLTSDDPGATPAVQRSQLFFPNGVALIGTETLVAETRAGRILRPGEAPAIPVSGGPDNLTRDLSDPEEPALIVALHPSLPRLGLYRFGWTERAPSRIARISLTDGGEEILFDDPSGRLFSGATVGVLSGGRLVAGSVRAPGLLICGGS